MLGVAVAAPAKQTSPSPDAAKPTLFIIGDSTVRNGTQGQQGWGDPIAAYFDPAKINVVNRAIGGRSSRTFLTEGRWDQVLAEMKRGDFVLMQFGHNDDIRPDDPARPRGSLRGSGEETRDIIHPHTKKPETVHTYGWYLRKYITDAKAKGATPIVLSPIPRNRWDEGDKVFRASQDYGKWAAESAKMAGAHFIDLNEIVARRYESLGKDNVQALFHGDWTHTSPVGAEINAASVVAGLKSLSGNPLGLLFSVKAADILLHSPVPAK
jgi:lysophospholipase L1-like esterase